MEACQAQIACSVAERCDDCDYARAAYRAGHDAFADAHVFDERASEPWQQGWWDAATTDFEEDHEDDRPF